MAPNNSNDNAALMLIPSKFSQPECPCHTQPRERLHLRLEQLSAFSLLLIHSPAGYGKTTFANQWLRTKELDTAWYSLDPSDNEEIRFAGYLLSSLNQAYPNSCEATLAIAQQTSLAQQTSFENLEQLFVRLFSELPPRDTPLILVLDDYHLIENPSIHGALRFFIKHMPRWLKLVITSRTLPPLGIASLRVQGKLQEVNATDLAFDDTEALALLNQRLPFKADIKQVERINQQIEGWASALQLIALSATDDSSFERLHEEFSRGYSHVLDYLAEEVLSQTPENVRQFLFRTSILERFDERLASAVTGLEFPRPLLEQVERSGLFLLPQDNARNWYRYHPLFAGFLQHQLKISLPDEETALHTVASDTWLELGFPHEAVRHALAASDSERITNLLRKEGWNFYQQGQLRILQQCLNALSSEHIAQDPVLTLLQAWAAQGRFGFEQVEPVLLAAEQHLPSQLSPEEWRATHGEFDTLRAQVAINQGRVEDAEQLAQQALEQLPEEKHRARIQALTILGEAGFCQGRLSKAQTRMQEAEQLARSRGVTQTVIWSLCQQSENCIAQGFLQKAFNLQDKALQYAQERHLEELPLLEFIHRIRAQVLWEWHHLDAANQACKKGLEALEGQDQRWQLQCVVLEAKIAQSRGELDICRARIEQVQQLLKGSSYHSDWLANAHATLMTYWESCNDQESIRGWLEDAPPLPLATNHFAQCHARNWARAQTCLGNTTDAIEKILAIQQVAVRCQLVTDQNRNHIYLARAYWQQEDRQEALDHLHQALKLATTTGFIGSFLRLGKPLIVMLKALKKERDLELMESSRTDRLLQLLQHQKDFSKALRITLDESLIEDILKQPDIPELIRATPLTRKEWQVLSLIHAGLSNDQIAQQQGVATSTIKTHIRSLYQKLNISQRQEAIKLADRMLSHIQGE
ncbi:HTH-type transcriptional regulator MalT [Motiliproteus sp. MSK22-1]|uniref:HTH-type transcriptional regulator MalT n=1 Tax=Motiliproteus sp. MSK22-1 TaxID=1897630 RepID=UPI000976E7CA|nr:HTH-type transcriptional regulator MalT [Motiliproteus sp. MSK22-1]OMH29109.1 transcriptional regulator MalT [Motiliproteus sp. MSK22-1]